MFPVKKIKTSLHIGTFDINNVKKESQEGRGISISPCPLSWRSIAQLSGPCYQVSFEKPVEFLDVNKTLKNKALMQKVLKWGIENDFCEQKILLKVITNDENGDELYDLYSSEDELIKSYGKEYETDECISRIEKEVGFVQTEKMQKRMFSSYVISPQHIKEFVALIYAEDILGMAGGWWNDRHDVHAYSAPRGVIFESHLTEVTKKILTPEQERRLSVSSEEDYSF